VSPGNITATQLQIFVDSATQEKVAGEMKTCMASAGSSALKMKSCANNSAKKAMATAMGKPISEISDTERNEYLKKTAVSQMQEKMSSCVAAASNATGKAACSGSAGKVALAMSLGKPVGDISTFELKKFQEDAGETAGLMLF